MARPPTYAMLRERERKLVAEINKTNRERAALAADDDRRGRPMAAGRFSRQMRMTRKLERLRDQLARVHEQMREARD